MHLPYGPHHRQYGDLRVPPGAGPIAVCVLVHGGGWQARYTPALMAELAADLVARGWATWNLEFRGIGADGGWPATESARAKGDRATLVVCPGDDHNAHLDPRSRAWATVVAWLAPWGP